MLQKNPDNEQELFQVYRSLVNVRQPKKAPDGFLEVERGQQSDARLFSRDSKARTRRRNRKRADDARLQPSRQVRSAHVRPDDTRHFNAHAQEHCALLESCYRSCLELADENCVESIAFCCISTGVFGFPKDEACKITVRTVLEHKKPETQVIFNVFGDDDYARYKQELS